MERQSFKKLSARTTVIQGHMADLKIETKTHRVWLSRCTRADGEWCDNPVTVEGLHRGNWVVMEEYNPHDLTKKGREYGVTRTYSVKS